MKKMIVAIAMLLSSVSAFGTVHSRLTDSEMTSYLNQMMNHKETRVAYMNALKEIDGNPACSSKFLGMEDLSNDTDEIKFTQIRLSFYCEEVFDGEVDEWAIIIEMPVGEDNKLTGKAETIYAG